jgi:hypothetical protein
MEVVQYGLAANELAPAKGFIARTYNSRSYSYGEYIDEIVQTAPGVTRSSVISVLTAAEDVAARIVSKGGTIHTPLFSIGIAIKGIFTSLQDLFDPLRHSLHIVMRAGPRLRELTKSMKTQKVDAMFSGAYILWAKDFKSGKTDEELTPLGNMLIDGIKIKAEGDDAVCGVFYKNLVSGVTTKIAKRDIIENHGNRLLIVNPDLPPGEYALEVVTDYAGSGKPLKEPRTVTFDKTLTVVAPSPVQES